MSAPKEAVEAVQTALAAHSVLRGSIDARRRPSCGECGVIYESPAQWDTHRAVAAADAAAPHNAAQALRDAAEDAASETPQTRDERALMPGLVLASHWLRDRADRMQAGQ